MELGLNTNPGFIVEVFGHESPDINVLVAATAEALVSSTNVVPIEVNMRIGGSCSCRVISGRHLSIIFNYDNKLNFRPFIVSGNVRKFNHSANLPRSGSDGYFN